MRYALVKTSDNSIDRFGSDIDPSVQTKSGYKWLQCPPVSQPTFDGTSETVDGPTYTVGASSVTEVWAKRALTTQEVSDRKDAAVGTINGSTFAALAKVLLNHENRIRALEAKAPVTMVQFKAGVKALL